MKKRSGFLVLVVVFCFLFGGCGSFGAEVDGQGREGKVGEVEGSVEGIDGNVGDGSGVGVGVGGSVEGQVGDGGEVANFVDVVDDKYRTFYEVFVYSFYDSDGDGVGDLRGVVEKLDYINDGDWKTDGDLGCNGIWLMPIMPSTTYHKYDVTDYCAIDPEYGSMEDFEELMGVCEERDIHVLVDLVMNHSSSKHEWFLTACDYLRTIGDGEVDLSECPYVDYYFFTKEKVSNVYYQVPGTDWYYEGSFWSEMPDLNLESQAVRGEFEAIIEFWLDKGVSGFRVDAAKEFVSDNTTANVEILSWLNETTKGLKEDAYIVAEVWTDIGTFERYYESGIDSVFNFAFAEQGGIIAGALNRTGGMSALNYGKSVAALDKRFSVYNPDYIDAPFYTNHDLGRSAGYYAGEFSTEKTKLAQAMNLMMSGNVFLYYGEELGMKGAGKDENKRAPMYWLENPDGEGMCIGPLDMDNVSMKYPSLEIQREDGESIWHFVKKAISLRNQYPAIARGENYFLEEYSDEEICVIQKEYQGQSLLFIWNMGEDSAEINMEELPYEKIGGELLTGKDAVIVDNDILTVPGYSMVLLIP